ncbi:MAG: adenine-specific methyltransferase EcoRI family protein [Chloroflexota bacterium]|nr:adenine-specific methyltransferase EcoRI family protein [Chloroflexota bacterium]
MAKNTDLIAASKAKKDEFYTQLTDIEKEVRYYWDHFRGKVVYCNCDDPTISNFFQYFYMRYSKLGIKEIIATCYKNQNSTMFSQNDKATAIGIRYNGTTLPEEFPLKGDGDFRSQECISLLREADIVVTNPPFSLFREYVTQLMKFQKKFLIIGNMNAATTKAIFPLIQRNKIWYGASIKSGDREFGVPDHYPLTAATSRVDDDGNKFVRVKGVRWYTNLDHRKRHEDLDLFKRYLPEDYPKYDNYDAIEVSKTENIPEDYAGEMGVPISFIDKYNPDQFQIVGADTDFAGKLGRFYVKGKRKYARIVIRNKRLAK